MGSVNVNKLRGKVIENGLTIASLAERLGMDKSTLYRKLEDGGRTMLIKDATAIITILGLTAEEATAIFFNQSVA